MDVEKTIELILESQLRAERRADKADQRADRAAQRADRADQRMDRFDKQLRATAALVKAGMKMVVEMRREQRESRQEQREMRQEIRELQNEWEYKYNALLDSQMRTDELIRKNEQAVAKNDEKFNRLLEILSRKHRNGDR